MVSKIDRKKINSFWEKRSQIENPRIATHFKQDDCHIFDLKLISKYITPKSRVLDLACGTCMHANKIVNKVRFVQAVDKYSTFLKYCQKSNKFITKECDLLDYQDRSKYDLILLFGILNYFNDKEIVKIYKRCNKWMTKNGTLLVKHQCGIHKSIIIDRYSPAIKDNYHAVYRHIKKDLIILRNIFNVTLVDIYPPRLNPWPDTHFYAFICHKKQK